MHGSSVRALPHRQRQMPHTDSGEPWVALLRITSWIASPCAYVIDSIKESDDKGRRTCSSSTMAFFLTHRESRSDTWMWLPVRGARTVRRAWLRICVSTFSSPCMAITGPGPVCLVSSATVGASSGAGACRRCRMIPVNLLVIRLPAGRVRVRRVTVMLLPANVV